jgi:hypothetical protein
MQPVTEARQARVRTKISLRWVRQAPWNRKVNCFCWTHSQIKRGAQPSPRARHSRAGLESSIPPPFIPPPFLDSRLRGNDGYFDRLVLKKARGA